MSPLFKTYSNLNLMLDLVMVAVIGGLIGSIFIIVFTFLQK